jgi:endonuclease/exonuclease/phosphatase (EEP) superfamily protein YafD
VCAKLLQNTTFFASLFSQVFPLFARVAARLLHTAGLEPAIFSIRSLFRLGTREDYKETKLALIRNSALSKGQIKMRLLTYNILRGGQKREAEIIEVIQDIDPDVVVVQEALEVARFQRIAAALEMDPRLAESRRRLSIRGGLLSRLPVVGFRTLHLWPVWPSCFQATIQLTNGRSLTVFGLHLAAYYPWFFEWWRMYQVRALLRYILQTAPGQHLLAGDFNAIARGDRASLAEAPLWVKAQTWFQLGHIPRWALKPLLDAGYVDCFRRLHPEEDGFTLPSPRPQVRLDYIFAAPPLLDALRGCRVITSPGKVVCTHPLDANSLATRFEVCRQPPK